MKDTEKFDRALDSALLISGSGVVWAIIYFGISILGNTFMFKFPVMLVTLILASALFITAFCLMRGFPLGEFDADARLSDSWTDEKKRAFTESFPKKRKLCRRMALISFGMLLPILADLVILFVL